MQGNVTEDAVSSRDDVTAAHSCAQAAPGGAGRHYPADTVQQALPGTNTGAGNCGPPTA